MPVVVRLLGEVSALVGGETVELGPPRQRCLFAALAVEAGRVVPVDRLGERVWGERMPRRGRETLHSYVSRLRHALAGVDGVAVVHRSRGYALDTATADLVDLHHFRQLSADARGATDDASAIRLLDEALALWAGRALLGVDGEWADAERDRLAGERLAARHHLVDVRLRLGQGEDLIAELAARSTDHPTDERVAGQHLLALHQAGRSADALEQYRRIRARLVEELGIEPGAALQDLHRRILDATDPSPRPATVEEPVVVPRQLPAPPASFVGRTDDLAGLDTALTTAGPGTAVLTSAIAGAGGIGKTWLALRWAHRHAHRFPDGQLFVYLRGFGPDAAPLDPQTALRGFLEALGVAPERVPDDPDARLSLFRSTIADKRVLLVLDNAADTAQVVPLLPGSPTCTVLVTSRNQLPGLVTRYGARHLPLDVLTDAEARTLLADRLGPARVAADEAAVRTLIALCGGFPLALGIVAAHAQIHPELPLAAVADELRTLGLGALDDDPTASLPAVLSWSHRALSPAAATAFSLFGIAPGADTGLPAAACLFGVPTAEAVVLLRQLEQASLLGRGGDGRYRMHDLVRGYAADTAGRLPPATVDAALRRVIGYYLHAARAADRCLNPLRGDVPVTTAAPAVPVEVPADAAVAMAWFGVEFPCLAGAQQVAAAHGWYEAVWDLAWPVETFLRRRGRVRDRHAVWQACIDVLEHLPDPRSRILAHRFLGRAEADLGHPEVAIEHLNRSLDLARQQGDLTNQSHAHSTLAAAWAARRDYWKAREHSALALALCRRIGNPGWVGRALNAVGWYAAHLGDHAEAREYCTAALESFERLDAVEGEATTHDSLGFIAHHTGDHATAVEHYRRAVVLLRQIGSSSGEADTLESLGHPYSALGRAADARRAWQQALDLYRGQNREEDAQRVQRNLDVLSGRTPARERAGDP